MSNYPSVSHHFVVIQNVRSFSISVTFKLRKIYLTNSRIISIIIRTETLSYKLRSSLCLSRFINRVACVFSLLHVSYNLVSNSSDKINRSFTREQHFNQFYTKFLLPALPAIYGVKYITTRICFFLFQLICIFSIH